VDRFGGINESTEAFQTLDNSGSYFFKKKTQNIIANDVTEDLAAANVRGIFPPIVPMTKWIARAHLANEYSMAPSTSLDSHHDIIVSLAFHHKLDLHLW
jgi:hypothetical protein